MIVFPLLLLFILGFAKSEFASLCKKPTDEYEVSNPNNCSTFIKCIGHNGTELSCKDGKLFDVNLRICLPPAIALCPADDIPQYVRDICKTLSVKEQQLVPAIECSKYYKCNGTNASALTCPNGLHYSRAFGTCTNPIIAGCRTLSSMCLDEYPGFGFPSLTCDKYFVCNTSLVPELKNCEEGLYFSPNNQNCTQAALSGCSNDETITTTTDKPIGSCDNPPVPICDMSNAGEFFPHQKPDWFYMCFNSRPLELQCESGLTYDTLLKYCVKEGANRVC